MFRLVWRRCSATRRLSIAGSPSSTCSLSSWSSPAWYSVCQSLAPPCWPGSVGPSCSSSSSSPSSTFYRQRSRACFRRSSRTGNSCPDLYIHSNLMTMSSLDYAVSASVVCLAMTIECILRGSEHFDLTVYNCESSIYYFVLYIPDKLPVVDFNSIQHVQP